MHCIAPVFTSQKLNYRFGDTFFKGHEKLVGLGKSHEYRVDKIKFLKNKKKCGESYSALSLLGHRRNEHLLKSTDFLLLKFSYALFMIKVSIM